MFEWWNQTITICNKLQAKDSITKLDTWKKTVLENCFYKQVVQRNISGTLVSVGTSCICRIPKSDDFKPYVVWKNDISDGFTLSPGDYIFKGNIDEDVTAENIINLYNNYKPNAMLVKAVSDNSNFLGLSEHYRVEGI